MNSKDVLRAFNAETPVRFGDLVFNRIESVNYKRAHYNQFITDATGEKVSRDNTIRIIQAICSDIGGNMYVLNPLRLEDATSDEVNIVTEVDYILNERLKLLPVFEAWCQDHDVAVNVESFIVFLFAEDLINAGKVYQVVKSFEKENQYDSKE